MGSIGIVVRADRAAESLGKDWVPPPLGPRQVVEGLVTELMEGAVELRLTANVESFPRLSGEAMQLTWHWQGPGKTQGLSDENLDALLMRLLVDAGYLKGDLG